MAVADTLQTAMMQHLHDAQTRHEAFSLLSESTGVLETYLQELVDTPDALPSEAIREQTAARLFHIAAVAQRSIVDLHLPYVLPNDHRAAEDAAGNNGSDHTGVPPVAA